MNSMKIRILENLNASIIFASFLNSFIQIKYENDSFLNFVGLFFLRALLTSVPKTMIKKSTNRKLVLKIYKF